MQLSSELTTHFKVVSPIGMLGVLGLASLGFAIDPPSGHAVLRVVLPVLWVLLFLFFAFCCFPLKHVSLEGDSLRVSGLRSEIVVPISDVAVVSDSSWWNPETVVLTLTRATPFGTKIRFAP